MTCDECDKESAKLDELERCESCADNANERAYERSLSDYYGGSGPQTLDEQCRVAWEQKRELKRG